MFAAIDRKWIWAIAITIVTLAAPTSRAQSAGNKEAAEALFSEGRMLMDDKKYAEACEKFAKSQELDPAVGTLLNIGECYEKSGKLGSAWNAYKQAEALAIKTNDKRKKGASTRAAEVEPRVSRLTVHVADASLSGLKITRDGADISSDLWSKPVVIDSGHHVVIATAPAKKDFKDEIEVGEGASAVLKVPPLASTEVGQESGGAAKTAEAASARQPQPTAQPAPDDQSNRRSSQRTWAVVAGGVGLVAVGVGTFLALGAKSKFEDAKEHCKDGTTQCDAEANSTSRDATKQGNLATVAWGVGIAGLATGAVLWLTAPKSTQEQATATRKARRIAIAPYSTQSEAGLMVFGRLP